MPEGSLPPMLQTELDRYEAKKNGKASIPAAPEVSWGEISRTLENNTDFRKLYKHLNEAHGLKGAENTTAYLKALLIDQFGWIPKRANSLETMGLVRLSYPALKTAKCPEELLTIGCKDSDWQDFLKICLDYVIRGGRHYMVSGENKLFLTQNTYMTEIYPKDSDKRIKGNPVNKWPVVNQTIGEKVRDDQHRLVLLLCATLGYNNADDFNKEKVAIVNSILSKAWGYLTSNVLELVDNEGKGYMLDLIGDKVKLQLMDTGYLCPVDNVVVDVTFCGYSPRMNGYIGKNNFDRFKVETKFDFPYFPFKSSEIKEDKLMDWIEKNLTCLKEHGVYTELHKRVYAQKPIFISAEHSAQQSREDLDKYEKEFNEGHLNVLSCSTTMEMGVDIGGISEVVMNNVPPKSANYLQRAGRAGRRNESKALALTFCAPNPIGTNTWRHPEYPITHVTETPMLKLESRQLIQRHVNALVFADYVYMKGGIRITANLADFFRSTEDLTYYDSFINHIDAVMSGQRTDLDETYKSIVRGTALNNISLVDSAFATKNDIVRVYDLFQAHMDSINKSIKAIEEEGGSSVALRSIQRQMDNFLKTSLLTYLAENSFLPSAGIPTGLVECMLSNGKETNYPTMHLSQAISAYAPGKQVVKNEWVYEPAGILMKNMYDDNTVRYIIQNCSRCGYTTINHGSALNDCPKCGGKDTMHGIKNMNISTEQRFTEVVEPAAFSVAFGSKPTRKINAQGEMNLIQPVLLEMDPWQGRTSSAKMIVRCSTTKSEILFFNRGRSGYGFAFCPYCGRMVSEAKPNLLDKLLAGHKHLSSGVPCQGGEMNGRNIRRHVLLVGRYQTDFVEVKFYKADNTLEKDEETLYSLGVILSRKLTELLGVNDGEIDFGYDGSNHSIFIYDTALGGAGYSTLFREYKDMVLDKAYETLSGCSCERACTKCLIDRKSQWYLNYLNRQKALDWLEMERKSRIAPKDIADFIQDTSAVTTDFATEMYQVTRNKNVSAMKLYVDNDYSDWHVEDFPYNKLVDELVLSGIDVAFVTGRVIDLNNCSISLKTVLATAMFKHKFQYVDGVLPKNLKPLMTVVFEDGRTKTYFGKNVNNTLSAFWGNGDIFYSMSDFKLKYSDVNLPDMLQQMANSNGTIMFDTRILVDCHLNNLFDKLVEPHNNKWNRIFSSLKGKEVTMEYSDRYLSTPLGCILLAHFIRELQQKIGVTIKSICITVKSLAETSFDKYNVSINSDYKSNDARNNFLSDAVSELVGINAQIIDSGYIEHERCLTVKTMDAELCIRPDAGIAHGWVPFGHDFTDCTDEDFRCNWDLDIHLYNKKQKFSGILYTISFENKR